MSLFVRLRRTQNDSLIAMPMRPNHSLGGWTRLLKYLFRVPLTYRLANLVTAVRFVVKGDSMAPSFSREQYILVSRLAYLWQGPNRGDVVVLKHPKRRSRNYIKRIIGLPGETILVRGASAYINGTLLREPYLNGKMGSEDPSGPANVSSQYSGSTRDLEKDSGPVREWSLDEEQYFVMGDNRANSDDSRSLGPLDRELIVGRAWARYWPRSAWGIIRS